MVGEVAGRVDQRKMREGLRKIAYQLFGSRFVLLAQQAHIIAERQHPFKQLQGVFATTKHQIGICKPETAREKHAFAGRQSIVRNDGIVALYESMSQETVLDTGDGADNARVLWRQKSDGGQHQQAGVELLAPPGPVPPVAEAHYNRASSLSAAQGYAAFIRAIRNPDCR